MRLIDAETLMERSGWYNLINGKSIHGVQDFEIASMSTIEVVRCRECVCYHAKTGWCDELSFFQTSDGVPCSPYESADWKMFMEDDFCSRGKRAEDNHESV